MGVSSDYVASLPTNKTESPLNFVYFYKIQKISFYLLNFVEVFRGAYAIISIPK